MPNFSCIVEIRADSAEDVRLVLEAVEGVTSVFSIEEETPDEEEEEVDDDRNEAPV